MGIIGKLASLLTGLMALLVIGAKMQPGEATQQDPFPTVPPLNATFPSPILPVASAVSAFGTIDGQPDYDLGGRLRDASGYLTAGVLGLAIGAAAYWLSNRAGRGAEVSRTSAVGGAGPRSGWIAFRSRLRRISWLAPSAVGVALLAIAASKCVPSKVCYANAGGVQIVVPCGEAEGQAEAQITPTATPGIDCPDPGRGGTNAYEVAKAGGTHSGYLREAAQFSDTSLLRALRSYESQVADHLAKIGNPMAQNLDMPWDTMTSDDQHRLLTTWCGHLKRNRELADIMLGLLRDRGINP